MWKKSLCWAQIVSAEQEWQRRGMDRMSRKRMIVAVQRSGALFWESAIAKGVGWNVLWYVAWFFGLKCFKNGSWNIFFKWSCMVVKNTSRPIFETFRQIFHDILRHYNNARRSHPFTNFGLPKEGARMLQLTQQFRSTTESLRCHSCSALRSAYSTNFSYHRWRNATFACTNKFWFTNQLNNQFPFDCILDIDDIYQKLLVFNSTGKKTHNRVLHTVCVTRMSTFLV